MRFTGTALFAKIDIPPRYNRNERRYELYLPLKADHPTNNSAQFADVPSPRPPGRTDLGLWKRLPQSGVPRTSTADFSDCCRASIPGLTKNSCWRRV